MTDDRFREQELARASRLLEFIKGELREMWVGARLDFVAGLLVYLKPELDEVRRRQGEKGA